MRMSIGLLGGVVVLFIGIVGIGRSADLAYEPAVVNGSNSSAAAYNMSQGVFEGVGAVASPAIVWAGVAAFVVLSLGLLVAVGSGGGR
jgi:hypothetical protein